MILDKIFGSAKKADVDAREATANEFISVKDIQGSILYTRTNEIFSYLKVQFISMGLLSETEKYLFVRNLTAEMSAETKPFRLLCLPRPVDISIVMDEYMELHASCTVPAQKKLLTQDINQLAEFATSGDVIERQYYIVLWEANREDAARDLLKRAAEWIGRFSACGVEAEILTQQAIIQLCNLFANPSYAHLEDTDYETTAPILRAEGGRR